MGGFDILNLLALTIAPFVSIAATNTSTVIPVDTNHTQQALAHVADAQFSTDPKAVARTVSDSVAPIELFVLTKGIKENGSIRYVITIRNTKQSVAKDMALGVTHPSTMILATSKPGVDTSIRKDNKTESMFFLADLAPGEQLTIPISFIGSGTPQLGAQLSFSYAGTQRVVTATYNPQPQVLQATDEQATPPSEQSGERDPQPAIICDPNIDNGCTEVIPNLGVNFQKARELDSRPVICSSTDPLDCEDKRPTLGERFREAVAVTEPGECRVNEDARISEPAFHDSFLRQLLPAAFYMEPLFDSGQDFKALVFEGIIEGVKYNLKKRQELFPPWQRVFTQHNDLISKVQNGEISGAQAITQLNNLILQLSNQLRTVQGAPEDPYRTIVRTVVSGYGEVAGKAVENTTTSIIRACQELNGEPEALEERLEIIREENLLPLLNGLSEKYPDGSIPTMSELTELRAYWNEVLYPALRAYDTGDSAPLGAYNKAITIDIFDTAFRRIYITHAKFAEDDLEEFRLGNWEIELDTPKTKATECEFEEKVVKVFDSVEETACEAGISAEELARDGSDTVKGQLGALQPPEISGSDNEAGLPGEVCGGRPGDLFWASDCTCKCGDVVAINEDGNVVLCEQVKEITRHDIFITDSIECAAEPQEGGHFAPAS